METIESEVDILMADDDLDDVELIELAMRGLVPSYTLRHAKDGDALFVLLAEKLPYILFLDVRMPCRDGLACIIELRRNREYDNLPVVMYSSVLNSQFIEECFDNGANVCMSKPSSFNTLVENLKKIFLINWREGPHNKPTSQLLLH